MYTKTIAPEMSSECGVCDEYGDNVVYEPPPIPEFEGHYRPNAVKAQRLRFRFAKGQDMVFIGHLDMSERTSTRYYSLASPAGRPAPITLCLACWETHSSSIGHEMQRKKRTSVYECIAES